MTSSVANDPALVAALVGLFKAMPTRDLVANLDVAVQAYEAEDLCLPLTLSSGPNCYINSPTVAYIDYAIEETRNFARNPILQRVLLALIGACAPLLRATGLDHQVQINNWLFSTNPVPPLTPAQAVQIRDNLTTRFPDRAIVLRSLNTMADADTINAMAEAGFTLLPARQIYIYDPSAIAAPSGHVKRDVKLTAKTDYAITPADEFTDEDFARAETLYNMLYLDKYTPLNPQYTARYLAEAHRRGLLRIIGLRGPDGVLDGVLGLFENGRTLTHPIIGYDTGKPQKLGLYRILSSVAQDHATRHGKFFNMSAGAPGFKRNRDAVPVIEYSAVYVGHLGRRARLATALARVLLARIGIPLLQRFAL